MTGRKRGGVASKSRTDSDSSQVSASLSWSTTCQCCSVIYRDVDDQACECEPSSSLWWGGEIAGGEENKLQQETHRGGWYYVSQGNYGAILVAFIRHIKETRTGWIHGIFLRSESRSECRSTDVPRLPNILLVLISRIIELRHPFLDALGIFNLSSTYFENLTTL